jgi:hypothetical protein
MIILILIITILFIIYQVYKERKSTYDIFIKEKTVFYFKTKPDIICIIKSINWNYFLNPKVELMVTYSSGTKTNLITTMADFNRLWKLK